MLCRANHDVPTAGWQGQVYEHERLSTSCPDQSCAMAMVACLSHVVSRVVCCHKVIRQATNTALSYRRKVSKGAIKPHWPPGVAASADLAIKKLGPARQMLGECQYLADTSITNTANFLVLGLQ